MWEPGLIFDWACSLLEIVALALLTVRRGEISEKQIDASVEKILQAKGFEVKQGFVEPLFEPIQK